MCILYTSADLFVELRNRRAAPGAEWVETTQEQFDEMLGCLPPAKMLGPAFLMGEIVHHEHGAEIYAAFWSKQSRYFARLLSIAEFVAKFSNQETA